MQSLPNFTPHGGRVSRLTYAVEIKPKGFLPVNLIEGRIATDLKANLAAIRDYVENIAQRLREETAALKSMKEEETIASQTTMLMECSPDTINVVNEDMNLVGTISSLQESRSDAEQNFVEPTIDSKSSITSSHLIEEDQSQRVSRASIHAVASSTDLDLTRDKAQLMRENEGIRRVVQAMELDLGDVLSRIREIRSLTRSQLDQEAASAWLHCAVEHT